ncbi:hypothetical protein FQA39_LY03890 [Lamprigera yunnana]|nr:hypothetical protein FQA39_LY03890 [Lamprigera yunnana]
MDTMDTMDEMDDPTGIINKYINSTTSEVLTEIIKPSCSNREESATLEPVGIEDDDDDNEDESGDSSGLESEFASK